MLSCGLWAAGLGEGTAQRRDTQILEMRGACTDRNTVEHLLFVWGSILEDVVLTLLAT